mmetsp:Transcript_32341/g.83956  ORF Transcript_32341/g.83956 Transcript_32341/m.83956 type:complete len:214 (+) Transcript_32341:1698-2339(+)
MRYQLPVEHATPSDLAVFACREDVHARREQKARYRRIVQLKRRQTRLVHEVPQFDHARDIATHSTSRSGQNHRRDSHHCNWVPQQVSSRLRRCFADSHAALHAAMHVLNELSDTAAGGVFIMFVLPCVDSAVRAARQQSGLARDQPQAHHPRLCAFFGNLTMAGQGRHTSTATASPTSHRSAHEASQLLSSTRVPDSHGTINAACHKALRTVL